MAGMINSSPTWNPLANQLDLGNGTYVAPKTQAEYNSLSDQGYKPYAVTTGTSLVAPKNLDSLEDLDSILANGENEGNTYSYNGQIVYMPPSKTTTVEKPTDKTTDAPFDASVYSGYVTKPDGTPLDKFTLDSYKNGIGTKDDFNTKVLSPYVDSVISKVDTSAYTKEQVDALRKEISEGKTLKDLGVTEKAVDTSNTDKKDTYSEKIDTALTDETTGALDGVAIGGTSADGTPKIAPKADVAKTEIFTLGKHLNADGTYSDVIANPTSIAPTADNGMLVTDKIATISKAFNPQDPMFMSAPAINAIADGIKAGTIDTNDPRLYAYKNVKAISDAVQATLIDKNDAGQYAADKVAALVAGTKSTDVNVARDSLVSHRLAGLLSANNPYLQDARNQATLMSSRRGLLNSGAAAGYAQDAAIRAGKDIATADAAVYADAQKANALAANNLTNTGMNVNASALISDASQYGKDLAANAAAQQQVDIEKARLNAHAAEMDASTYASSVQKIAEMQTTVNTKAAELKATASQSDAANSLSVAKINNANDVTAVGADAKTITDQANTQFAADNRKEEVQATLDSGGLQFNAGAANTASNNYNSEWNTMTRQITAGNIELAGKAAVNAYNMLEASQDNGYKSQQMALAQEYSLQGIRLTGQVDFDKLQFQATIDTAQKTQDRNASVMVSMYNGLLDYSKVIDTTVGFTSETKAALKNEAYVKISEALNTLTNSKSLNIAEILQPPETGKTAGYIKGTSFANLNDLAFTANKWGADFYSKKWTDLTDAQASEIEKNKNKSPYWKEMVRSLDANSFASLKAPVTPVSPETAATINS